jgi:hypothetical protein
MLKLTGRYLVHFGEQKTLKNTGFSRKNQSFLATFISNHALFRGMSLLEAKGDWVG